MALPIAAHWFFNVLLLLYVNQSNVPFCNKHVIYFHHCLPALIFLERCIFWYKGLMLLFPVLQRNLQSPKCKCNGLKSRDYLLNLLYVFLIMVLILSGIQSTKQNQPTGRTDLLRYSIE